MYILCLSLLLIQICTAEILPRPIQMKPSNNQQAQEASAASGNCHLTYPGIPTALSITEATGYAHLGSHFISATDEFFVEVMSKKASSSFPLVALSRECSLKWTLAKKSNKLCVYDGTGKSACVNMNLPVDKFITIRSDFKKKICVAERCLNFNLPKGWDGVDAGNAYNTYLGNKFAWSGNDKVKQPYPIFDNYRQYTQAPPSSIITKQLEGPYIDARNLKFCTHFNGISDVTLDNKALRQAYCSYKETNNGHENVVGLSSFNGTSLLTMDYVTLYQKSYTVNANKKRYGNHIMKQCSITGDPHAKTFHGPSSKTWIDFGNKDGGSRSGTDGTYLLNDCTWTRNGQTYKYQLFTNTRLNHWIRFSIMRVMSLYYGGSIYSYRLDNYANAYTTSTEASTNVLLFINGVQMSYSKVTGSVQLANHLVLKWSPNSYSYFILYTQMGQSDSHKVLVARTVGSSRGFMSVYVEVRNQCFQDAQWNNNNQAICERNTNGYVLVHNKMLDQTPGAFDGSNSCRYTQWTPCSEHCGGGTQKQFLISGGFGQQNCLEVKTRTCNSHSCSCPYAAPTTCASNNKMTFRFRGSDLSKCQGVCPNVANPPPAMVECKKSCSYSAEGQCKYYKPTYDNLYEKTAGNAYKGTDASTIIARQKDPFYGLRATNKRCGDLVLVVGLKSGGWKCHPYKYIEALDIMGKAIDNAGNIFNWNADCNICVRGTSYDVKTNYGIAKFDYCNKGCGFGAHQVIQMRPGFSQTACKGTEQHPTQTNLRKMFKHCNETCDHWQNAGGCSPNNDCKLGANNERGTCQNDKCEDVNCRDNSIKVGQRGGYSCVCSAGYRLSGGVTDCVDIDECKEGSHDCDRVGGRCINTQGSYTCACNADFIDQNHGGKPGRFCLPNCIRGFDAWSAQQKAQGKYDKLWNPCVGECGGIREKTRAYTNPAVKDTAITFPGETKSKKYCQLTAHEYCPTQKCEPLKPQKCTKFDSNAELKAKVIRACKAAPEAKREDCFEDCCITEDITAASKFATLGAMDCFAELLKLSAQNPGVPQSSAKCAGAADICQGGYNKHPNHPGACDCGSDKDVVTGNLCDRPVVYTKGHCTFDNVAHPIKPQVMLLGHSDAENLGKYFFNKVRDYQMPQTILIFSGQPFERNTDRKAKHQNHLFVVIDSTDSSTAGSVTFDISQIMKKRAQSVSVVKPAFGNVGLDATTTFQQTGDKVTLTWTDSHTQPVGFYIPNTGGNVYEIKVDRAQGIKQVLIGSGNGLGGFEASLEVYPVTFTMNGVELATEKFSFSTTRTSDKCSQHFTNCTACMADKECGYCRDTEECVPGTHAGPWRGGCREWRFTMDSDVSRRVSWTSGFPVNAKHMDVYLADQKHGRDSETELPVTISVTPQPMNEVIFDVVMLVPQKLSVAVRQIQDETTDIVTALKSFTQPKACIGAYNQKSNGQIQLPMHLSWGNENAKKPDFSGYVKGNITQFTGAMADIVGALPKSDTTVFQDPLEILGQFAKSTKSIEYYFRDHSRRIIFFFAGQPIPDSYFKNQQAFEKKRAELLKAEDATNFFPVFLTVNDAVKTDYDKLVDKLGFGEVLLTKGVRAALVKSLSEVLSSVTLVLEKKGHVDESKITVQKITGLQAGQKARFNYVLHKSIRTPEDHSSFVSPGFGRAAIDAVPAQQPKCRAIEYTMQEDEVCEGAYRGKVLNLNEQMNELIKSMTDASSKGNTASKDKIVLFYITEVPSKGQLFQWNGAAPTTLVNVTEGPVLVSSMDNLVFYVPPEHAHSPPAQVGKSWKPTPPYETFKFATGNMCSMSDSCSVTIKIEPVDDAPTAQFFNLTMYEDEPTEFDISQHFNDPDVFLDLSPHPAQWRLTDNKHERFRMSKNGPAVSTKAWQAKKEQKFFVHPVKDENGLKNIRWNTEDKADTNLKTQGVFQLYIIPVNDAPTITPTEPYYLVEEDTVFEFRIHGRDIDSGSFSYEFEVPADFKGSLGVKGSDDGIPHGQTNRHLASKTVPMQSTLEHTQTFRFKPLLNEYSCNLEQSGRNANEKKACDPKTDIYTGFTVWIVDKEGLTSTKQEVKFIVLNVNDAPQVPHTPIATTFTEEGEAVVKLDGVDVDGDRFDAIITTFPEGVTVYQYSPKKEGRVLVPTSGKNKGLVTDAEHRVILVGNKDKFGSPLDNFLSEPLSYHLYDGRLYSEIKDVDITIYPSNDPPVAADSEVTTLEDTPLIIPLQVEDTDNKMTTIVFKMTALPNATVGTLHHFDRRYPGNKGPAITKGQKVRVQNCALEGTKRNYGACVVFDPALNYHTHMSDKKVEPKRADGIKISFSATDRPQFGFPGQSFTRSASVYIHVYSVNDVPYGSVETVAIEDKVTPITLQRHDVENDATKIFVHSHPNQGKLFQYHEGFESANPSSFKQIVASKGKPVEVTDPKGRVLYVGPEHKHTDSHLAHMIYQPQIAFTVKETSTKEKHESPLHTTIFSIDGVNDAPHVWDASMMKGESMGRCHTDCTFKEDFGSDFHGPSHQFRDLYFGGWDIETDDLTVSVQSLECGEPTFFFTLDENLNEVPFVFSGKPQTIPGSKFSTKTGAKLHPKLKFRPGQDKSGYKCTLVYKVDDGQLLSENSHTITITITPVNDAPRAKYYNRFWVEEDTEKEMDPEFLDVEGDKFTVSIVKCSDVSNGKFYRVVDGKRVQIPCQTPDVVVPDTKGNNKFIFVPNAGDYGDDYNSIVFKMVDQHGKEGHYTVAVDVLPINDAPVIYVGQYPDNVATIPASEYKQHIEIMHDDGGAVLTKDYSFWEYINVMDIDVGPSRIIDLNIKWTFGRVALDAGFKPFRQTNSSRHYQLNLLQINELLNTLTWSTDEPVSNGRLEIRINDRGYVGMCPPDQREENQEVCPQVATIKISLNSGYHQSLIHGLVVATPVVAAAAVVVALGVLAATSSTGATAAQPQYQPWEDDGACASNPLFQSGTTGGENSIYAPMN